MNFKILKKKLIKDFELIAIIDMNDESPGYYKDANVDKETFACHCFIVGRDKIILGYFKDKELTLISLFHEIGHLLVPSEFRKLDETTIYDIEKKAWELGINKAKEYGIKFSDKTILWSKKQLETYNKEEK